MVGHFTVRERGKKCSFFLQNNQFLQKSHVRVCSSSICSLCLRTVVRWRRGFCADGNTHTHKKKKHTPVAITLRRHSGKARWLSAQHKWVSRPTHPHCCSDATTPLHNRTTGERHRTGADTTKGPEQALHAKRVNKDSLGGEPASSVPRLLTLSSFIEALERRENVYSLLWSFLLVDLNMWAL